MFPLPSFLLRLSQTIVKRRWGIYDANPPMHTLIDKNDTENYSFFFPISTPYLLVWIYAYTWCTCASTQAYTHKHALWPTSPSRLALLIRGTMWHCIPSGTRHRLCQLCIVLCLLESTHPNHCPPLLLSSSFRFCLFYCLLPRLPNTFTILTPFACVWLPKYTET